MRFLLTEARASTCFAFLFAPSLISSRLNPRSLTFTVIAVLLTTVVETLTVSCCSGPFYSHSVSEGP